jgi:hypothetical protein
MNVYENIFFLFNIDFLVFMALNEVITEVLSQGNVTLKFRTFYSCFNRVNRAGGKT